MLFDVFPSKALIDPITVGIKWIKRRQHLISTIDRKSLASIRASKWVKHQTALFSKVFLWNQLVPSTLNRRRLTDEFNCDRITTPKFNLL